MSEQYGQELVGKTVVSIEISDGEVLVAFTDGSEIAITVEATGGDYGVPILQAIIS